MSQSNQSDEDSDDRGPLDERVFEVWEGASAPVMADVAARVSATIAADSAQSISRAAVDPGSTSQPQQSTKLSTKPSRAPRRSKTRVVVFALALPAAAALAVWGGRQLREASGETAATARETVRLGGRGTAVLEPGARVRWSVSAANQADVHQEAGDVFYRVEKGGPFSVHTPAGVVQAVGTCFRVEVDMNGKRQSVLAGAGGAALAAAVVVSVYEGKVLLAGDHAPQALVAGERAVMEGDGLRHGEALPAPRLVVRRGPQETVVPEPLPPPEQLPAKYQAQSAELARLRAEVEALREGPGGPGGGEGRLVHRERDNFVDPTREELLARAKNCTLAWDSPPLDLEQIKVDKRWGLTPEEAAIVQPVLAKFKEDQLRSIRELYVEVTGARALSEQLSPRALTSEIKEKAPPGEVQRAFQQISGELAGTIPPPGSQHKPSAAERLVRLQSTAGERFERAVAAELGPARAHEIRKQNNGWNSKSNESMGCPRENEAPQ